MSANREEYIISLIDQGVSRGLKDISRTVTDLRSKMGGLDSTVQQTSGGMSSLSKMALRFGAVAGIGYLGKQIWDLGTGMEQTKVAFSTFMGDAEKANVLIGQLNEFANITPFDNAEVLKSGQMLLSAGLGADQVTESLRMIGDVASGVAMPLEDLSQIYMKAMNKGKLQAEELNQMSERGIPLMQELARMTGKSKGEIYKLAETGAITSDIVQQAFQNMTGAGGMYHNMMDKQSQTVGGRFSTLIGKLQTIGIAIGESLLPVIGAFVDFGVLIISNKSLLKDLAIVVGILSGAFLVYKIATIAATLWTGGFSASMAALNVILYANPIGLVIAAIAILVTGVVLAIRHFDTWGQTLLFLMGPFGRLISFIKRLYDGWEKVKKGFSSGGLIGGLKEIGRILLDTVLSPLEKIAELLGFDSAVEGIKKLKRASGIDEASNVNGGETVTAVTGMGLLPEKEFSGLDWIRKIAPKVQTEKERTPDGGLQLNAVSKIKKTKKASNISSGLSEIQNGAPKTFNINIGSLIKEQSFTQVKDLSDIKNIIKDEVSKLLLGVVNNVQTT
jgi:tape measure domain-containing protein